MWEIATEERKGTIAEERRGTKESERKRFNDIPLLIYWKERGTGEPFQKNAKTTYSLHDLETKKDDHLEA